MGTTQQIYFHSPFLCDNFFFVNGSKKSTSKPRNVCTNTGIMLSVLQLCRSFLQEQDSLLWNSTFPSLNVCHAHFRSFHC